METEKPKSDNDFRSCLCKDITRSSASKQTHSYLQTAGEGTQGCKGGLRGHEGAAWVLPVLLSPALCQADTSLSHG